MNNKIGSFRLRQWLSNIPVQDPVDRRMAALLQVILIGFASIIVIATLINLVLTPAATPRQIILLNNAIFLFVIWIPFFLLRRGYFRSSVFTIIAVFIGLETYAILSSDLRSISETLTIYTLAILLAGLLIGRKTLIVTFTISVAAIINNVFRQHDPQMQLDGIAIAGNFILLNGLMGLFIDRFGFILRAALNSALERENELKKEIQARSQIETEREQLIAQLEVNNAELERFTYTVSHDLRSPLVTIKGFIGVLQKDIQNNRPDKIQDDFARISKAADKMDSLLSELLELSRVGRIVNPPEKIDLAKLIDEALESVHARIHEKNISIRISSSLPTLYGDRLRLREVYENLIDNAAKYIGDQPNPHIEIGADNTVNESIYFVKDNGMGIDPQYHIKIFGLFEKLNSTVEGTGIGLALVKRIIEVQGGKVWVESEGLGKGSKFCFTLPNNKHLTN